MNPNLNQKVILKDALQTRYLNADRYDGVVIRARSPRIYSLISFQVIFN